MPHRPAKPAKQHEYHFHTPLSGSVDRANGIILGVSLITSGVTALGHELEVDDVTVTQMLACAKRRGQVPTKFNHGSGMESVGGFAQNFRVDGHKLLFDWHLLKSHSEYETTLERAERMPTCFGMSAAFLGGAETVEGKKKARCTELLAVDCVTRPAANPDGLFNARQIDTHMSGHMETPEAEPTLKDLMGAINGLKQTVEAQAAKIDALEKGGGENDEPQLTLEDLDGMTDEELANLDLTRAQVDAAVAQAQAAMEEGGEHGEDPANGAAGNGGGGNSEGAAAAVPAAVGNALSAMQREINLFKARDARAIELAEQEALDNAFAIIEEKVIALSAENEALREKLKTAGSRPAARGAVGQEVLFNAKETPGGSFESLAQAKVKELRSADPKLTELSAQSQALDFCVRHHKDEYSDYRKRGSQPLFEPA